MSQRQKKGRPVNGIVLLDKPAGLTSNQALQRVKRIYQARKAGHTGSLDPLATGLLPVCLGEATKVSGFLLNADKEYRAVCKLGVRTDSGDADGQIIDVQPVPSLTNDDIEAVLAYFRGEIEQVPPMYSAIKQNGVPLYRLAREGLQVEREVRVVSIFRLQLLRLEHDELEIDVHCSKGTYVRTLCEDIGARLGCGGHIKTLQRVAVGPFRRERMVTIEQLEALAQEGEAALDAILLPFEEALADWPRVSLPENAAYYLRRGQPVFVPGVTGEGWIRLFDRDEQFLGMGVVLDDGRIAPKRLVNNLK